MRFPLLLAWLLQVDHVWVKGLAPVLPADIKEPVDAAAVTTAQREPSSPPTSPPRDSSSSTSTGTGSTAVAPTGVASGLSVGEARLMPQDVDDSSWSSTFALSDHRPLQVKLTFSAESDAHAQSL